MKKLQHKNSCTTKTYEPSPLSHQSADLQGNLSPDEEEILVKSLEGKIMLL